MIFLRLTELTSYKLESFKLPDSVERTILCFGQLSLFLQSRFPKRQPGGMNHPEWFRFSGSLWQWWGFGPSPSLSTDVKFFLLSNLLLNQPLVDSIALVKNLLFDFIFDSAWTCLLFYRGLTVDYTGSEQILRVYFAFLLLISNFVFLSLLDRILDVFHAQTPWH